jgi:ABC-type antimicrobial peptide transport system permease subunit
MVVVDRTALSHVDTNADRLNQVWTSDAQLDEAVLWIKAAGYNVLTEITSDVVIGTTGLLPVTWILGYLRALAILIGVVAIAGLVFALAARTRRRTVSYVLSRRMGMTKLTHLRSLLVELAIVVGFGWLLGSGAGAAAFGVIFRSLDVYPSLPPPAAYGLPAGTLVATAVVTAAVVVLASLATHALAERANPAEILRLE